ncbi:hypothetical protein [Actinomycetospora straminea]|uniref:Uncharacterized protein n=1 Tax=Actinomycetospora straminea TaxID=663607 RepID=A0ABP9FAC4_9PSEU|nr:hypothetical protein [Actinomycetospora straminea]MDD7936743.1 hypothetical protein [Actinomycetospora straminea]
MYCPVCLEEVEEGRPVDWTMPEFLPVPTYRHSLDGSTLCIRIGMNGYEPTEPTFTRLELIRQRTEAMQTAEAQRLALVVEELDAGGSWAEVLTAAGVAGDGIATDELEEMVTDYRHQREE